MDIALNLGWVILGLVGLYYGAEWLVHGSAGLALMAGLSSLIVGLTVVAFGTSTPELIVSIQANLQGNGDFALGNVIGSNICNIGLVLGLAAVLTPITLQRQFIWRELTFLIVVSVVFVAALLQDGQISRLEGLVFATSIIGYTIFCIHVARRNPSDPIASFEDDLDIEIDKEELSRSPAWRSVVVMSFWVVAGLTLLLLGANRLVTGGEYLAKAIGVSDAVIALTLVAFGTSLPELATTIVACRRGESDMAAGNAIGSCLFNLLCVVGFTAIVSPIVSTQISVIDLGVMVVLAVATPLLMLRNQTLGRGGGVGLLLCYFGYVVWQFTQGTI